MCPSDFGQDRGARLNKTAGITNSKPRILFSLATKGLAKSGRTPKFKPQPGKPILDISRPSHAYAELQVTSNFSFLRGGSHPEELLTTAAALGYRAIAITDFHTLSGIVRAHQAAKDLPIQFIVGCRLLLQWDSSYTFSALVYPRTRAAYGALCRLLTRGNRRSKNNSCILSALEFITYHQDLVTIVVPPEPGPVPNQQEALAFTDFVAALRDAYEDRQLLSIALSRDYGYLSNYHLQNVLSLSSYLKIPLVATGNIYYHSPERRPLQDVLTCIREKSTISTAGFKLLQNAERWLKPPHEVARLFRETPRALTRTIELAEMCESFSLDQLRYDYPEEVCPAGKEPIEYLRELVEVGAATRYPQGRFPQGIPTKVKTLINDELALIKELQYEKYFLTCYDIVQFAHERNILCQGRGAAANSAVCYCLGITSVDPERIDLLFARFISRERNEPPDIDIDFEHERREEVIQYIYEKYGRDRAGLTCEVITYRYRSAIRDVGRALGLPVATVSALAKSIHRWTGCDVSNDDLRALGINPHSTTIKNAFYLAHQLRGFPRHISQHVGGFIISEKPLNETVPIRNAGMESRTIIEWDKDDIEVLGMLKIDVLALGMLTCIRRALSYINHRLPHLKSSVYPLALHSIPAEDPKVYDMICQADTIGVFQIESRAQMSMLPRLKPRCFYDLVVEVALVRPGPIQGNMVHPYLKRRAGLEAFSFPDERVANILGKTLGVPIFQEQAMRLAIVLAQFTPGEAEQLRRAMAAWKRDKGVIATFKERIVEGMLKSGYSVAFAETCMNQIKGFSEYGFPESHAASFALLVYASAWIKCHFPAEFAAALLNSQPMGFYAPSQLIRDAQSHGVRVLPIDSNCSKWETTLEYAEDMSHPPAVRLGMHLIKGLSREQAELVRSAIESYGKCSSVQDLWYKVALLTKQKHVAAVAGESPRESTPSRCRIGTLSLLAEADAFQSIHLNQRQALWEIRALPQEPTTFDALTAETSQSNDKSQLALPLLSAQHAMFKDYQITGLSLRAHPLQFIRARLNQREVSTAQALKHRPLESTRSSSYGKPHVRVAGIAIVRQRPGTAKGVTFITLEDETGITNLIIRPHVFEKYHRIIIASRTLLAEGTLDRVGEVVYVSTFHLESLDSIVLVDENPNLPNLSYSY